MTQCGIYSITHISSGKRYIGSSINIKRRWNSHCSSLNKNLNFNPHLQNTWNKYGKTSFVFEVLEENISPDLLEDTENDYIIKFGIGALGSNVFDESKGFNTQWAGRTGCVDPTKYKKGKEHYLSGSTSPKKGRTWEEMYGKEKAEELKKQISESQTGRIGGGMSGKNHSAESRKKMSDKRKGKPKSKEQRDNAKGKPWSEARRAAQENRKRKIS